MTRAVERWPCQTTRRRRHSRILPQGDGRAGPAFTRRAVGSECNLIVLDACHVLDNAFAVGCPGIDAEGKVSSQLAHLRPLFTPFLLLFALHGRRVGQALAPKAIAERLRSGGVWEAESNIDLLDLVPTPAAANRDASFTVERINL